MNKSIRSKLTNVYKRFLNEYGRQYWWPADTSFEVMIGAVMTQNTSWKNVVKAISRLKSCGKLSPVNVDKMTLDELSEIIRPCGYHRNKAQTIKNLVYFLKLYNYNLNQMKQLSISSLRKELLNIKGIGPETADSILLYAFEIPIFVVDSYTRRIFSRIGILAGTEKYSQIQKLFHSLPKSTHLYKEYHALIVKHAKERCKKKPVCSTCCINDLCRKLGVEIPFEADEAEKSQL